VGPDVALDVDDLAGLVEGHELLAVAEAVVVLESALPPCAVFVDHLLHVGALGLVERRGLVAPSVCNDERLVALEHEVRAMRLFLLLGAPPDENVAELGGGRRHGRRLQQRTGAFRVLLPSRPVRPSGELPTVRPRPSSSGRARYRMPVIYA
jgi:hypothetical protein